MSAVISNSCDRRLREISVSLSRLKLNMGPPHEKSWFDRPRGVCHPRGDGNVHTAAAVTEVHHASSCGCPFVGVPAHCGGCCASLQCRAPRSVRVAGQPRQGLCHAKDSTQGTHVLLLLGVQVHARCPYGPRKDFRPDPTATERAVGWESGESVSATRENKHASQSAARHSRLRIAHGIIARVARVSGAGNACAARDRSYWGGIHSLPNASLNSEEV